ARLLLRPSRRERRRHDRSRRVEREPERLGGPADVGGVVGRAADGALRFSMPSSFHRAPGSAVLVTGIVLLALNLRGALAGVGPLVADLRGDTGLSNTAIGLLTAIPLLAFGLLSILTPLVTRRVGVEGGVVL